MSSKMAEALMNLAFATSAISGPVLILHGGCKALEQNAQRIEQAKTNKRNSVKDIPRQSALSHIENAAMVAEPFGEIGLGMGMTAVGVAYGLHGVEAMRPVRRRRETKVSQGR